MDRFRKANMQIELNSVMDVKNKKGFFSYIRQKGQAKESVLSPPPPDKWEGRALLLFMEKADILNKVFASVFMAGLLIAHMSLNF